MSEPTPSLREQGVQALREGNLDKAIDVLARAVMADDKDAEAKVLLGVTYSQKGLHTQAKRAIQTAVELEPQNPNFRFNLGVVLERGGDMAGAAIAYRDTLSINKDHAQARAKLGAIPNAHQLIANTPTGPAPTPGPPGAAPGGYGAPPSPPSTSPSAYGQPPVPPPGYAPPGGAVSPPPPGGISPMGAPPSQFGAPPPQHQAAPPMMPGAGTMGDVSTGQAPPGTVQCPRCARFAQLGMTCEWCQAPLPPPTRSAPADPVMAASYGQGTAFSGGVGYSASPEDGFSIGQAVKDWWASLVSPRSFFEDQAGREGIAAPMAYMVTFLLIALVAGGIPLSILGVVAANAAAASRGGAGAAAGAAAGIMVAVMMGSIVVYWLITLISTFIYAGLVHAFSKMFGGTAGYSGTYRAVVYAMSAMPVFSLIGGIIGGVSGAAAARRSEALPLPAAISALAPQRSSPLLVAQGFPNSPNSPLFGTRPGRTAGNPNAALMEQLSKAQQSPLNLAISLLSALWYMVMLGTGICYIHSIGGGRAAGVVILSNIACCVATGILVVMLGAVLGAAIAGAMGGLPGAGR